MFNLGAQALIPGHRHKIELRSDTGYSKYPSTIWCPRAQNQDLVTGNVHEHGHEHSEKCCVHISGQRESYSDIKCELSLKGKS